MLQGGMEGQQPAGLVPTQRSVVPARPMPQPGLLGAWAWVAVAGAACQRWDPGPGKQCCSGPRQLHLQQEPPHPPSRSQGSRTVAMATRLLED